MTRRELVGSAVAIAGLTAARARADDGTPNAPTPVVSTNNGPVRGLMEAGGIFAFKGLRYGAPPIGPLRFRPPQPPAPWKEVAIADRFGAAAIQSHGQPDAPADEAYSEDCLFLNVWTQGLDRAKRPVMVWLHGGAFSTGAAGRPTYYGDHFARDGVVLVSLNHRLNVFGYTQLPDTWGEEYASSGLAGILDIVQALNWVRKNIARFGGDPNNVTIFGESGGGAKVSLLLGLPSATGLYHKAIIQSGAALDAAPRAYAQALGQALTDELKVKPGDVAGLAAIDSQMLFQAQDRAVERVKALAPSGFLVDGFVPSVDGIVLPRGPFTPGPQPAIAEVPLLIGTNKDEMTLFLSGNPAIINQTDAEFEKGVRTAYPDYADRLIHALRAAYPGYTPGYLSIALATAKTFWLNSIILAERKLRQPAPVWMYRMDWGSPIGGGRLKAAHAMELSFVFGTQDNIRGFVGPGPGPTRMAAQMHPAWVAFAKTGNPQTAQLPTWPRYDAVARHTMIFNLDSRVESDPLGTIRRIMLPAADT
jgi:para-nitrobenzyl esterase